MSRPQEVSPHGFRELYNTVYARFLQFWGIVVAGLWVVGLLTVYHLFDQRITSLALVVILWLLLCIGFGATVRYDILHRFRDTLENEVVTHVPDVYSDNLVRYCTRLRQQWDVTPMQYGIQQVIEQIVVASVLRYVHNARRDEHRHAA